MYGIVPPIITFEVPDVPGTAVPKAVPRNNAVALFAAVNPPMENTVDPPLGWLTSVTVLTPPLTP